MGVRRILSWPIAPELLADDGLTTLAVTMVRSCASAGFERSVNGLELLIRYAHQPNWQVSTS